MRVVPGQDATIMWTKRGAKWMGCFIQSTSLKVKSYLLSNKMAEVPLVINTVSAFKNTGVRLLRGILDRCD